MSDADLPLSLPLVAYRLAQAELVQRAMQVELHELRHDMSENYIRREEVQRAAAVRREWPLIIFAGVVSLTSIASLIVQVWH